MAPIKVNCSDPTNFDSFLRTEIKKCLWLEDVSVCKITYNFPEHMQKDPAWQKLLRSNNGNVVTIMHGIWIKCRQRLKDGVLHLTIAGHRIPWMTYILVGKGEQVDFTDVKEIRLTITDSNWRAFFM